MSKYCHRAHDLAVAVGDRSGEAHALRLIGAVRFRTGDREGTAEAYRSAIMLAQEADDPVLEGETWISLAAVEGASDRHAEAFDCALRAMEIARSSGDRYVEAMALGSLGHACVERGDHHRAISYLTAAVAICERDEFPKLRAHTSHSLGLAHHRLGHHDAARGRYRAALDLARRIGAPEIECVTLMDLGDLALAEDDPGSAVAWRQEAVTVADRFGEPFRRARARDGLGDAYLACGDIVAAIEQWRAALRIHDDMDSDGGGPIRAKLAAQAVTSS